MCVGLEAVEVVPSPKSHSQLTTDPSGSELPSVNVQSRSVQVAVNAAVGLVQGMGPKGRAASGMVNAVLDKIARRVRDDLAPAGAASTDG